MSNPCILERRGVWVYLFLRNVSSKEVQPWVGSAWAGPFKDENALKESELLLSN